MWLCVKKSLTPGLELGGPIKPAKVCSLRFGNMPDLTCCRASWESFELVASGPDLACRCFFKNAGMGLIWCLENRPAKWVKIGPMLGLGQGPIEIIKME